MIANLIKSRCFYLDILSYEFPIKPHRNFCKVYFDSENHPNGRFDVINRNFKSIKYIISSDFISGIKNNINDVNGFKVNFNDDVLFPRNLLSLFDNIKKVNKAENADYIIIEDDFNFINGSIYISSTRSLSRSYLFYNNKDNEYFYLNNIPGFIKLQFPDITDDEYIKMLYDNYVISKDFELVYSGDMLFITEKHIDIINTIINNTDKIIFSKDFSKYIISRLPDITDDVFDNIKTLFESRNTNNIQMAFKILSGYNFQKRSCHIGEVLSMVSKYKTYMPPCVSSKFVLNNIGINSWYELCRLYIIDALYCNQAYSTSMDDFLYAKNLTRKYIEDTITSYSKRYLDKYESYNFTLEYDIK